MDKQRNDTRRHKHGPTGWLRLDQCSVDSKSGEKGRGYPVTIEGVNLRGAISPPAVTVGGRRVHNLEFAPDGRTIRGVVDEPPESEHVVVDYGFARAELGT